MSQGSGKRKKIYPKRVSGRFRTIRWSVSTVLLGAYFILPWLRLDGRQALLFDIPGRKFYIFNLIIWPQEVYYLAFLIIFLVIAFFMFTAVAGRLWCGYACPQTVFTDIFMSMERMIEGDRRERMRLDEAPWTAGKFLKKALKHGAWLVFSFATAFTFLAYFTGSDRLLDRLVGLNLTPSDIFWLGLFTLATYGDCGFLRELMCLVPCPYGRFQSALFDQDTLIIGYDAGRGEPRGPARKQGGEGRGDCVDCTLCVQVCPTGIDIRDGLQYECIACAQCVDACNMVMRKLGRPEGLIRYGSLRSLTEGAGRILRPRVVVYALVLVVLLGAMVYKLGTRVPLDLEVQRDRRSLYQTTSDGRLSNVYTIKAMNMDSAPHRYMIRVKGIEADIITGTNPILVGSGEVYRTTLVLIAERERLKSRVNPFLFVIEDVDDPRLKAARKSTFLMP